MSDWSEPGRNPKRVAVILQPQNVFITIHAPFYKPSRCCQFQITQIFLCNYTVPAGRAPGCTERATSSCCYQSFSFVNKQVFCLCFGCCVQLCDSDLTLKDGEYLVNHRVSRKSPGVIIATLVLLLKNVLVWKIATEYQRSLCRWVRQ